MNDSTCTVKHHGNCRKIFPPPCGYCIAEILKHRCQSTVSEAHLPKYMCRNVVSEAKVNHRNFTICPYTKSIAQPVSTTKKTTPQWPNHTKGRGGLRKCITVGGERSGCPVRTRNQDISISCACPNVREPLASSRSCTKRWMTRIWNQRANETKEQKSKEKSRRRVGEGQKSKERAQGEQQRRSSLQPGTARV